MAVVEVKNLNFTYPDCVKSALKNINFRVEEGETDVYKRQVVGKLILPGNYGRVSKKTFALYSGQTKLE